MSSSSDAPPVTMRSSDASFEFAPLDAAPVPVAPGVSVAQASGILEAAQAEADAIREAARAEGFQAGFDAGMAQAAHQLSGPAQALGAAHAALGEQRALAADAVERDAVELGLRIAEKALSAAIDVQPERVVDVVRSGLRRLLERERVVVLVHPEDMELVRAAVTELRTSLGGIGDLDVQAERRVSRGGAIVRTETAEVDGRLETQLERARETLVEALSGDAA